VRSATQMKWLVYGANGWIGRQYSELLKQQGEEVVVGQSRVDDTAAVRAELAAVKPERVVCLVGRTHNATCNTIDCLESKDMLKANLSDNLYSQVSLALLCKELGLHLTVAGTGCIYEYDEQYPVDGAGRGEHTPPNFFASSYSVVKGFCDRLLTELPVLVLRVRMPISADRHGRSFLTKILKYEKVCSIENSMTVLPTLLPVAIDLAKKQHVGPVNFTNAGSISHNRMLQMYTEIVDPDFTWRNFTLEEQAQILKAGRSNNKLEPETILRLYPDVPNIEEAVRMILLKIKAADVSERRA
jgi:3,5-epimerase/4-reductase